MTTGGRVAGQVITDRSTGVEVWRFAGIPYGAAPVGERRFRPPCPAPAWDGVRPALEFGPSAPQRTSGPLHDVVPGMAVGAMSEDCLTVNVWAPLDVGPTDDLPVLVWVHGGAYVMGGSALATYDGAHLCATHEVVVVSFNYRLGVLGFLTLPEVAGTATNCGLLDQLAAIRWTRENVAAFGGDPAAITLFGESAGAGAILHLLAAPASRGLFGRAILQSPGAETIHRDVAEELGTAFLRRAGEGAAGIGALPVDRLLDAQEGAAEDLAHAFGAMPWAPVIDGELLPADPRQLLAGGAGRDVDVIVGTTSSELGNFTGAMAGLPPAAVSGVLRHLLRPVLHRDPGEEACNRLMGSYLVEGRDPLDAYTQVLSDASMGVPALRLTDALATHHGRTFSYRFDWRSPGVGACHASDLPFTFGTLDRDGWAEFAGADADADAYRLAEDIGTSWATFARTGDPSNERVGQWPSYSQKARATMMLGRTCAVVEHPLAVRLPWHDEMKPEGIEERDVVG